MAKGYDQLLTRNTVFPKRGYHPGQSWKNVKMTCARIAGFLASAKNTASRLIGG